MNFHTSEILARVRKVYRECVAYEDSGEVRLAVGPQPVEHALHFRTSFFSPDRLRFSFMDPGTGKSRGPECVIWGQAASDRSWWSIGGMSAKNYENLDDA